MFLRSILLGGTLALLYDLLRPLRRLGERGLGCLLDVLVSLVSTASLFFFFMAGDGELRLFILLGALGGAILFFCLLSQPLRPLWDFWFQLFLAPLLLCGRFFKKLYQFCKKVFSFLQNWFTITITLPLRRKCRAGEGDEKVAQTQKPKKKRPSSKLTGLILVILLFGIGVQLYHMYGQLQAAQAEESVYAQRLAELQETNRRLEDAIENSDDPELIEDKARDDLGMVSPGEKILRFGN